MVRGQSGGQACQDEVAPHVQRRNTAGKVNGVPESGPHGHERGGRDDAFLVRFQDALIHAAGETEVVRVDDQPPAPVQKSPSLMLRNFLGLARKSFIRVRISWVAPFRDS